MLALVLAAGGEARAQDDDLPPGDGPGDGSAGTYRGVAPGEGAPDRRRPHHGRTPQVTWLGFQAQPGGGARVFVQLDREVPHRQQIQDGALVVSLEGARAMHGNTRRFLDTRFFDTAVERVSIERARRRPGGPRRARGLELVIRFKNPADAREVAAEMSAGKDGFAYLMVELPRGAAPAGKPSRP